VGRGFTAAERWVVRFEDGWSAFAKVATEPLTVAWLRLEKVVYSEVAGPFLPHFLGWEDDGERPILLLEDLSRGRWPPPWPAGGIELVLQTLEEVHGSPTPQWLPSAWEWRGVLSGWTRVAADPEPFLSLGLASADWLRRNLPALVEAEAGSELMGNELPHFDVRSDNICLMADRAVIVDWNYACRGNGELDLAAWLPSLEREGGPPPEALLPDSPSWAATISGYFASVAGLPPPDTAPTVRGIQLDQLRSALPWAVRAIGLEPPPGRGG
jgi:hypothetical protein